MGGGGAASSIASGQPLSPSVTGGPPSVASATSTGNVVPMGADPNQPPTDTAGTPIPTGTGAGMGTGTNVYGDFIKSEYFKNNDFDGYFLSVNKGLNLPTLTDATTGRATIDWKAKDANGNYIVPVSVFNSYGNMTKLWSTLQGLSKEKDTFNSLDIEKNPVFKEQLNVLDAEMQSLQKQFNLNVDAQLAGLQGSIDVNKAGLEYELNTIKREIGASNWRSRQSLAASGMAFSGMLGYLYGQNEAKGMDATIRATSISAAEIKAIGNQMAILDGSKLSYASDLERLYGAKRALARATILSPQNGRLEEIGKLIDQGIADFETEKGLVAPGAALEGRATEAAVSEQERTDFLKTIGAYSQDYQKEIDRIQAKIDSGDKSEAWKIPYLNDARNRKIDTTTGQAKEEFVATIGQFDANYQGEIDRIIASKDPNEQWKIPWLKLARVDKLAGITKEARADFLNTIGQYADNYQVQIDKIAGDKDPSNDWQIGYLKQARLDQIAAKAAADAAVPTGDSGGGGTGTDTTVPKPYDPKGDLSILSNSGTTQQQKNRAALNITASTGALTDANFSGFMQGGRYAIAADGSTRILADGEKVSKGEREMALPGLMGLDDTSATEVIHLIEDPVRQMAAAIIYSLKGKAGDLSKSWFDPMQSLMEANKDQYQFSVSETAAIEKILIAYFGTKPGPGA